MKTPNLLVLGLGNPGAQYEHSRHNVGAATVDLLAARCGVALGHKRADRARVAMTMIEGVPVVLAVPSSFMNESGLAASALARHYLEGDASLGQLIVVHDELDLEPGTVRLKFGGGAAGHNGIRSIGQHLHSLEFARVRIGIGKPPGSMSGADYVLRRTGAQERAMLHSACERAADAVELIARDGLERAMNFVNTR